MNLRSIHFRLISWYTCLVIVVCIGFGAYTYKGLQSHLYSSLTNALTRRTILLGRGILSFLNERGEKFTINEIKTIFSTEENSRFMRIKYDNGNIFYISGLPKNELFNPAEIPDFKGEVTSSSMRKWKIDNDASLVILTSPFVTSNGVKFIIEVGENTESIQDTLNALLLALFVGLPFVIFITAGGGYLLVKNSLQPVEKMRIAAEEISLKNLQNRLPIVQTGDNIEHLSNTLNRMISRMEQSYQQASRFSADASHELRTPLTVMRGELESIIMDSHMQKNIQDRIGTVLEETNRLTSITEGLLAISRLDAGEARMNITSFDISELAKVTLEQMRLLADEKNITVSCEAYSEVIVEADPSRIKQVIVNLLDNAIKYTPIGGNISLKIFADNKKAIIEVADNGIGIANTEISKIFERFYRADKARSRELGGTGLGLSIVKSICVAHNGDIKVRSEEGKGSCFSVELQAA